MRAAMLEMLKPPEWGDWPALKRGLYAAGLVGVCGLMLIGAVTLYGWAMA